MAAIKVSNLKKYYQVSTSKTGVFSTFKSLFHRRFKTIKAVDDISFKIKEGELVGFIGPNGAGKTTTLKVLSGLLYPTAGEVSVLGYKPFERKVEFQKQFAFVTGQKNQLWWDLPAMETFLLNKEIYQISDNDFKAGISELSSMLDISDLLDRPVRKLSLGQRMKAEIINAIIHRPKILLLDEPTIGLDVIAQEKMRQFIKNYNSKSGATIILTSHNMADVERLAKRVIVIDHGKIFFDGKLTDLIEKYARFRRIELTLEKEVEKGKLEQIAKVKQYLYPKVSLLVDRKATKDTLDKLLEKFEISDFTVEEPAVEDVVREMFTAK